MRARAHKVVNSVANDNEIKRELTLVSVKTLSYNHFLVYFIFYIKSTFYQKLKLWHGVSEPSKNMNIPINSIQINGSDDQKSDCCRTLCEPQLLWKWLMSHQSTFLNLIASSIKIFVVGWEIVLTNKTVKLSSFTSSSNLNKT